MKRVFRSLLALSCLLGLAIATASAQTAPAATPTTPAAPGAAKPPVARGKVQPKARAAVNPAALNVKDGLMMKEGKVILTELGIQNPLTTTKTLVNRTTITPTGLVTAPDGTTTQMGEGDMVSLTGRVTSRRSIVEADSLLKIKMYDLKYPGKRERDAKIKAEKDKAKKEREEQKAKMAAERAKDKAKGKR